MSELTAIRRKIRVQAISVGLAVAPFGAAFGALCTEAGLGTWEALGFSSFVFGGSSQFAAVTVLAEGGTIIAAVVAGLLLNLRSLGFGVVMAPSLQGSLLWRALTSQLMIDEATAKIALMRVSKAYLAGLVDKEYLDLMAEKSKSITGYDILGNN